MSSEKKPSSSNKKTKKSKPSLWKRCFFSLSLFCIIAYIASLVLLNTTWFKEKLAKKLQEKLPQPLASQAQWKLGRITWMPFGDVLIQCIQTPIGEGEISLKKVAVKPSWSSLFSAEITLDEILVDDALIDIDLDWLKENYQQIAPAPRQNTPQSLPLAAINKDKENPTKTKPKQSQTDSNKGHPALAKNKPQAARHNQSEQKNQPDDTNDHFTHLINHEAANQWFKADNIKFIFRNKNGILEQIDNLSIDIPFAGKPNNEGEISLLIHGEQITQKIEWDGRALKAATPSGQHLGISYQWQAFCDLSRKGLPFHVNFTIPEQALDLKIDIPNFHWSLTADSASMNVNLSGGLRSLNTWRGLIQSGAQDFTISENQKLRQSESFEELQLIANLSHGKLSVPTAEAIGYDLSILANGAIQSDLYTYGVVRLIAHERSHRFINRVHRGAKVVHIDTKPSHFLLALDTPDRTYCDLFVDGKLTDLEIRHNRSQQWQSLNMIIKKLIHFKDNELLEDGLLEAPKQNMKLLKQQTK